MPTTNPSTLHPEPSPAALPYNPALSLWLSVDPLSDKYPSLSPYTYCGNNPVGMCDPDGEDMELIDNVISSQIIIDNNATINDIGSNNTGDDPPKWWQNVKSTCSTVKQGVVKGLEAADRFCQSDVVGRVAGALSQINPIVSLTNAATTVFSDQDMFGNPATTTDKVVSVAGAAFTVASEARIIIKGTSCIPAKIGEVGTTTYSVIKTAKPDENGTKERH